MITSNSIKGIRRYELTDSTTVNAGGSTDTQVIQPSVGEWVQVVAISATIPAIGGASGNHSLTIKMGASATTLSVGDLVGTDGAVMYITKSSFIADTENPSDVTDQLNLITNGLVANNDEPISFVYKNSSDVNQTGTRVLRAICKVYREVL